MTIIEYKADPQDKPDSYNPKTIPDFVDDGGYWGNPDTHKMIGVGVEGSIPDGIETFTLAELQSRQLAIHAQHPMKKTVNIFLDDDDMTVDEVNAAVKSWWDERS